MFTCSEFRDRRETSTYQIVPFHIHVGTRDPHDYVLCAVLMPLVRLNPMDDFLAEAGTAAKF